MDKHRKSLKNTRQNTSENPRSHWKTIENHRKTLWQLARTEGDPGGNRSWEGGVTVKYHAFRPETTFSFWKRKLAKARITLKILSWYAFISVHARHISSAQYLSPRPNVLWDFPKLKGDHFEGGAEQNYAWLYATVCNFMFYEFYLKIHLYYCTWSPHFQLSIGPCQFLKENIRPTANSQDDSAHCLQYGLDSLKCSVDVNGKDMLYTWDVWSCGSALCLLCAEPALHLFQLSMMKRLWGICPSNCSSYIVRNQHRWKPGLWPWRCHTRRHDLLNSHKINKAASCHQKATDHDRPNVARIRQARSVWLPLKETGALGRLCLEPVASLEPSVTPCQTCNQHFLDSGISTIRLATSM